MLAYKTRISHNSVSVILYMTMGTKKELFGIDLNNYLQATKEGKGVILDNLERQTEMHRISLIRSFRRLQLQSSRDEVSKRGRKEIYTHECMEAIQFIWKSADYCCGDLLHPVIEERILIAKKLGLWTWNDEATNKVRSISISTLKRKIPKWRPEPIRRGISTTTPSAIKDAVPLFEGDWKEVKVGSGQIDTVAHCGGSMAGDFIFSCGYVDASSGWTFYQAQWNKGMEATLKSLQTTKDSLPFLLCMLHPDCGTEFLNSLVMGWCERENIDVTRSRSYHKNDNGYIEQRNNHVTRKWFGYVRLGHRGLVPMMNKFYTLLALYSNHFQAQRLCTGTKQVSSGKVRKVYESKAKAPYVRVLEKEYVPQEIKDRLFTEHQTLNPFALHEELINLRNAILKQNRTLTEEGLH